MHSFAEQHSDISQQLLNSPMASLMSKPTICFGLISPVINTNTKTSPYSSNIVSVFQVSAPVSSTSFAAAARKDEQSHSPSRRSGNYPSANWGFDYVQSLNSEFSGDQRYIKRWNMLKEKVGRMLDEEAEPLKQLELIDDLQRLGVCYHFKDRIKAILSVQHKHNTIPESDGKDLYATAVAFRLMRQHGFYVSQEVFDRFKDEKGEFKINLCKETEGILQLYEASYFLTEKERTLESAREFAAKHLEKILDDIGILDQQRCLVLQHALELPLHWRVPRVEARWFIDLYEKRLNKNATLLQLAQLDFNIVQAAHQADLKDSSRWWESTCLGSKLNFARDRLVENFFWTIGIKFEPEFGYFRRMATKVNALVTTIDDVYDVYGSLDELQLFTTAVERWDGEAIAGLPDYMKICYLALYNAVNEMAYDAVKEQGVHILPYLRKAWAELCKSYLREAKCYHSGYTPTLEDYLENAWISISAPVILVHAYFFVSKPITEDALQCFDPHHNIIRLSAMILRLADDLATSSEEIKRGDVPKSVECYMNETGVSVEEAREHIRFLISEIWKKLNKERVGNSAFPQVFTETAVNLARMAQCMYQYGDGHGHSNSQTKDRIRALLFDPVAAS